MTRTNTILGIGLIVQLGLVAVTHQKSESHGIQGKHSIPSLSIDRESVSDIEVWSGDASETGKAAVVLHRGAEGFILSSHANYPAEEAKVSAVLSALAGAEARRPITSSPQRQIQLKVANDSFERKIVLREESKETTLYIGVSAGQGRTAIRVAGENDIYGVRGLSSSSFGEKANFWVDTQYFKTDKQKLRVISLNNTNGTFDFKGTGKAWEVHLDSILLPNEENKELKQSTVDSLLSQLSSIHLKKPVSKDSVQSSAIVTVLMQSDGEMESSDESQKMRVTLELFKEGDTYIIHEMESPAYVQVEKSSISQLIELSKESILQEKKEKPTNSMPGMPRPPKGGMPMPNSMPF